MGRMHAITKQYRPAGSSAIRSWQESEHLVHAYIPADQTLVLTRCDALLRQLHTLPRDRDTYGLVHGDFQANNFVIFAGKLLVFDFGACEYNWFVSDIAVALYFHLWEPHPAQDNRSFAAGFIEPLLAGYERENPLDAFWRGQIPLF